MEAIRINTIIDPALLPFSELKHLKGRKAEIIILVEDTEELIDDTKEYKVGGMLNEFANINLVSEEKSAWEKHTKEKYGDR